MKITSEDLPCALIQLRHCLWIPALAACWFVVSYWGTPHVLTEYRFSGLASAPVYHRCVYVGLHSFVLVPQDGECPMIVMARSSEARP